MRKQLSNCAEFTCWVKNVRFTLAHPSQDIFEIFFSLFGTSPGTRKRTKHIGRIECLRISRFHVIVATPIQTSFDIACTIIRGLIFIYRQYLINLRKFTCRIVNVWRLAVPNPMCDIFELFHSFYGCTLRHW